MVWAGGNDFYTANLFDAEQVQLTISTGVANTVTAVQRLHRAGARRILVVNLPDLGLTPFGNAPETGAFLSYISAAYNDRLDAALDGLAATGVKTIRMSSSGVLQDAVANPWSVWAFQRR